jgi:hypothetical protein
VREGLLEIFQETYNELRLGTSSPDLKIEFFAFANVNNTIRLREGRLLVRLSDLLEGAPELVLRAIAHILLAKIYRKPIDPRQSARYRKYVGSHEIVRKVHLVRQMRGSKRLGSAKGFFYDLDAVARPPAHELEPAPHPPHSRPLRSGAQRDHYQPDLRPLLSAAVRGGVHCLPRDAASQTSRQTTRKPALRALGGVSC